MGEAAAEGGEDVGEGLEATRHHAEDNGEEADAEGDDGHQTTAEGRGPERPRG